MGKKAHKEWSLSALPGKTGDFSEVLFGDGSGLAFGSVFYCRLVKGILLSFFCQTLKGFFCAGQKES